MWFLYVFVLFLALTMCLNNMNRLWISKSQEVRSENPASNGFWKTSPMVSASSGVTVPSSSMAAARFKLCSLVCRSPHHSLLSCSRAASFVCVPYSWSLLILLPLAVTPHVSFCRSKPHHTTPLSINSGGSHKASAISWPLFWSVLEGTCRG